MVNRRYAFIEYANGDTVSTPINGTPDEIRAYYAIGREANVGFGPEDNLTKLTACHVFDTEAELDAFIERRTSKGCDSNSNQGTNMYEYGTKLYAAYTHGENIKLCEYELVNPTAVNMRPSDKGDCLIRNTATGEINTGNLKHYSPTLKEAIERQMSTEFGRFLQFNERAQTCLKAYHALDAEIEKLKS